MATFVKGGPAADWGKRLAIPVVTQLSSRIRPVVHRPGAGPPSRIKHVDPRTGRNRLFYATRQRIQVSAAFASLSQQAWCAPAASVMGMHENNPIQPVNAFSNAVDPRKLYPHFDHLMRNLYHSGQQHGTDLVWHRNVLVCAGQLVRIVPLAATNNAPLPPPGMEWEPGNRPPEADPNPTCAMGRTSRPPAAAYVQYRGTKPTAHPCVVAHRHR